MSNSVETKTNRCALTCSARPPAIASDCLRLASLPEPLAGVPSVPSGVPLCASAPPVKGVLRLVPHTRKQFFPEISGFLSFSCNLLISDDNLWRIFQQTSRFRPFRPRYRAESGGFERESGAVQPRSASLRGESRPLPRHPEDIVSTGSMPVAGDTPPRAPHGTLYIMCNADASGTNPARAEAVWTCKKASRRGCYLRGEEERRRHGSRPSVGCRRLPTLSNGADTQKALRGLAALFTGDAMSLGPDLMAPDEAISTFWHTIASRWGPTAATRLRR